MTVTHQLEPGQPVDLDNLSTRGKDFHESRAGAEAESRELRQRLIDLQPRLYAEGNHKLLIVFQAMDAGGKDSHIRRVLKGVNPQGVSVTSFKVPSREELAHDFLWRIHKAVPAKGMIGVFNRSHYEDVLVVRVHDIVPEPVWRPRYQLINDFEKMLVQTGTTILKFYLHISKEEQRERFQDRVDRPDKHWKFSFEDLEKRKLWDDYMVAFQEMLERTTTTHAPWYVIPADQKWYSTLAVIRAIVGSLEELNPQYPPPESDLSGVVVK
ncbi:MAG: polyphosphate kinase 2 family protein [Candidatus Promineifilaceae bacterium]|nr:polyphosphate kinase 2 family protein [Candidatus Promineifilaceae bacterium]